MTQKPPFARLLRVGPRPIVADHGDDADFGVGPDVAAMVTQQEEYRQLETSIRESLGTAFRHVEQYQAEYEGFKKACPGVSVQHSAPAVMAANPIARQKAFSVSLGPRKTPAPNPALSCPQRWLLGRLPVHFEGHRPIALRPRMPKAILVCIALFVYYSRCPMERDIPSGKS